MGGQSAAEEERPTESPARWYERMPRPAVSDPHQAGLTTQSRFDRHAPNCAQNGRGGGSP